MESPRKKRELSREEEQDAQIGLLEWELEDREERHGIDPLTDARRREVLIKATNLMRSQIRATDMLARYGGDEFVILLPNTNQEHTLVAAEKVRAALDTDEELNSLGVTASIGVCSSDVSDATDPETFIKHADEAAYKAKQSGKNRVEVYSGI